MSVKAPDRAQPEQPLIVVVVDSSGSDRLTEMMHAFETTGAEVMGVGLSGVSRPAVMDLDGFPVDAPTRAVLVLRHLLQRDQELLPELASSAAWLPASGNCLGAWDEARA